MTRSALADRSKQLSPNAPRNHLGVFHNVRRRIDHARHKYHIVRRTIAPTIIRAGGRIANLMLRAPALAW